MGYVLNGKYYKDDASMKDVLPTKTSVFRQSDHDRQRADHKKDLIKPHLPDGSFNPVFLEAYPEEAIELWGWEPPETEDLRSTL